MPESKCFFSIDAFLYALGYYVLTFSAIHASYLRLQTFSHILIDVQCACFCFYCESKVFFFFFFLDSVGWGAHGHRFIIFGNIWNSVGVFLGLIMKYMKFCG